MPVPCRAECVLLRSGLRGAANFFPVGERLSAPLESGRPPRPRFDRKSNRHTGAYRCDCELRIASRALQTRWSPPALVSRPFRKR